jgi:hypothetical protein
VGQLGTDDAQRSKPIDIQVRIATLVGTSGPEKEVNSLRQNKIG